MFGLQYFTVRLHTRTTALQALLQLSSHAPLASSCSFTTASSDRLCSRTPQLSSPLALTAAAGGKLYSRTPGHPSPLWNTPHQLCSLLSTSAGGPLSTLIPIVVEQTVCRVHWGVVWWRTCSRLSAADLGSAHLLWMEFMDLF